MADAAEAERLAEEERLVRAAQAGDMHALRPIFMRYAEPLFAGVILPRLGDRAAAEDVLRDTFATALEKLGQFRWEGHGIYAWLRQIAVNKVIDVHRRAKRTSRMQDALMKELADEPFARVRADEALIAEEERRRNAARIAVTMEALSERYRQAIQLRLVEELERAECAQRMGITLGNFDVLLFRAVRAFRKLFDGGDET